MGQTPYWFCCPRCRKGARRYDPYSGTYTRGLAAVTSDWSVTKRIRRRPRGRAKGGFRSVSVLIEYRCSAGHVGWTTHIDAWRSYCDATGERRSPIEVATALEAL